MKADSNTEMDSLLRRHARRRGAAPVGASDAGDSGGAHAVGSHLDADEMNAYAEGALPAGARARYVSHLADCDECRGMVAKLALAANIPLQDEERVAQQTSAPKSSWREWLAALFAPPMIRYGATALALFLAVGVVFLLMRDQWARRQREEPTLVAQNDQRGGESASAVKPESAVKPAEAVQSSPQPATQSSPAVPEAQSGPDQATRAAQPLKPSDTETEGKTKRANEDAKEDSALADATRPAAAPLPANEPSQQQQAARDERGKDVTLAKRAPAAAPPPAEMRPSGSLSRPQERGGEADRLSENRRDGATSDDRQTAGETARNSAGARESEEAVAATKSAPAAQARRRSMRGRAEPGLGGADSSATGGASGRSEETRNVGGRQFRRQGGAWVDKAYAAGRATVNVARGSEQYRALVADEPSLRAIAEQLGGEVIVVWKGRAYRIY